MDQLTGTGVALITPFHNREIDFDALGRIIDHVIDGSVEFVVSLGTTGESTALTREEKRMVIDFTLDRVAGRVPVVAGQFGGNNTSALCDYIDNFDFRGIAAILSSSPAYNKPTQEGIYLHYKAVADHCPVPVILYNVPGRTASNLTAGTTLRLARDCRNIVAIKEASADMVQTSQIVKDCSPGFTVLSGDDPTALSTIMLGGQGVISVIANAFPGPFSDMIRAARAGDIERARTLHHALLDVHPHLYKEGNPTGIKGAMEILNLCRREARLPLTSLSASGLQSLKTAMDAVDISNL